MRIGAEHEAAQGGSDAVTFSFADVQSGFYGLARLGLAGEGEARRGSALAILFSDRMPVEAIAEGDIAVRSGTTLQELSLAGLASSVVAPLEHWSVRLTGERHSFDLIFDAASPPAGRDATAVATTSGYEQLCRVHGTAVLDGEARPVAGRGQRGHSWGSPDWTRLAAVHTVSAWMDDGRGVALTVARERDADGHDADSRWGALLDPAAVTPIADPRLSTTYDDQGRQRRAGLELWLEDEDGGAAPRRAAGSLVCGSSLVLGQLTLDCAFMRWTMDGADGVGRYDVLRRA